MARFRWSAATLVFVLVALASALFMAVTSTYLVIDALADARGDATTTTHAVSIALADSRSCVRRSRTTTPRPRPSSPS
ncbi:hypothetical protein [Gulosibacter massiliensis]|uniref:hypothetical protein n=1 Tax=Gulosibacter massiliensis TaxID=2479839 RepID=UPI001F497F88|nr:hypothetical protein [Gulosibacter massiliensis]